MHALLQQLIVWKRSSSGSLSCSTQSTAQIMQAPVFNWPLLWVPFFFSFSLLHACTPSAVVCVRQAFCEQVCPAPHNLLHRWCRLQSSIGHVFHSFIIDFCVVIADSALLLRHHCDEPCLSSSGHSSSPSKTHCKRCSVSGQAVSELRFRVYFHLLFELLDAQDGWNTTRMCQMLSTNFQYISECLKLILSI